MLDSRSGGARAVGRTAALVGLFVLAIAGEARAGQVPPSALARSLELDPRLLDSSMLVFRFPQLVAARDSATLSFGKPATRSELFVTTTGSEYGLGAALRGTGAGAFATSQFGYLPVLSDLVYPRVDYNQSNALQLGAGGQWRFLRVGAALRGMQHRLERSEVYSPDNIEVSRSAVEQLEGAAGIGFFGRGATFDAVFEWGGASYEAGSQRQSSYDTLVVRVDGEPEGEASLAARLTVPVGSRLRIVAVGESHWGDITWSGQEFRDQQIRSIVRTDGFEVWFAGLSFLFPASHLDCMAVSATFERRDQTLLGTQYFESPVVTTRELDYGTLAVSAQRGIWRTLVAQAGFIVSYKRDYAETHVTRSDRTEIEAARRETIEDAFGAGLSYSWRSLQLTGDLYIPPDLSFPIAHIDIAMGF